MVTRSVDDQEVVGASRYNVPALEKGLDICELLAREPQALSLTEIAQRLGRSTGECYRLIQYLDWRGYLDRSADDRYALSMRMFRLSHEHPPVRSLVSCAIPVMEELAAAAGQSCHLGVLDRASVVIVTQVDSPLPIRYSVRLGAQFPVWETSSGLLLSACLAPARRAEMMAHVERLIDARQIAAFERKIDAIAADGHEARPSELVPGILNLCRPVYGFNRQVAAVLTVPFIEQRTTQLPPDAVDAALGRAVDAISAQLGHHPIP